MITPADFNSFVINSGGSTPTYSDVTENANVSLEIRNLTGSPNITLDSESSTGVLFELYNGELQYYNAGSSPNVYQENWTGLYTSPVCNPCPITINQPAAAVADSDVAISFEFVQEDTAKDVYTYLYGFNSVVGTTPGSYCGMVKKGVQYSSVTIPDIMLGFWVTSASEAQIIVNGSVVGTRVLNLEMYAYNGYKALMDDSNLLLGYDQVRRFDGGVYYWEWYDCKNTVYIAYHKSSGLSTRPQFYTSFTGSGVQFATVGDEPFDSGAFWTDFVNSSETAC